jgi:hypothetical protein
MATAILDHLRRRRQDVLIVALAFAIPFGLSIGWFSGPPKTVTTGLSEVLASVVQPVLFTISAFEIVRKAAASSRWVAVLLLSPSIALRHVAPAFPPALFFLQVLLWFVLVLLLSCATERRTWALCCVVACGACVTGGQLLAGWSAPS